MLTGSIHVICFCSPFFKTLMRSGELIAGTPTNTPLQYKTNLSEVLILSSLL